MTRRTISLNDARWRIGAVAQKKFADVNDLAIVTDWLPAQVPGDVRLDLLRAGKISDPFYADNNEQSQWVDARDWWYARDLALQLDKGERAFLICDGIDYQSAVFVDGKQLGRHTGMFARQIYEIPTADRRPPTALAVRVWGSDALPKLKLSAAQKIWARLITPAYRPPEHPFPDRFATLKCQMQFGWDFAPRLRTAGIWDDISIVVARSVFIRDIWVKSSIFNLQSLISNLTVLLTLDSDHEQDVRATLNVRGKNFRGGESTFEFDLHVQPGIHTHTLAFDLPNARLWNPWDRGEPNLYNLAISLSSLNSLIPLDSLATTFGIRSFELAADQPGAEPWHFVINGQREFLRGANWVPLDAIPGRLTRGDYAARLQQARDANINFLRVWGGGLREKKSFYDLCDELGILVWQEFPFACALLDNFPRDTAHLQLARDECGGIVQALRNHPSLVVWCGGNEFNTRNNQTIVNELSAVVAQHDGTRPFKPASPYKNESHNWRVWHRFANLRDYRKDATPFLSEFGVQALPNLESLKKFLPAEALTAPHRLWTYHHAEIKKLERYAKPVLSLRGRQSASGGRRSNLSSVNENAVEDFVHATQRAQAFALQIAIEHLRRRKPHTAGVAVWQFNDAWGAISWSLIDYYGAPKQAYYELQKLYTPVLASFDYPLLPRNIGDTIQGDVWLINDGDEGVSHVDVRAELNGAPVFACQTDLPADASIKIGTLQTTLGKGENILRLVAQTGTRILSDHTYDLDYCDDGEIGLVGKFLMDVVKRLMR